LATLAAKLLVPARPDICNTRTQLLQCGQHGNFSFSNTIMTGSDTPATAYSLETSNRLANDSADAAIDQLPMRATMKPRCATSACVRPSGGWRWRAGID
jgi:hypothetical protein